MRKRKFNPKAIALILIVFIVSMIVAGVIKSVLPISVAAFKQMVFWLITLGISGPSAIFIGMKFNNKGGRR